MRADRHGNTYGARVIRMYWVKRVRRWHGKSEVKGRGSTPGLLLKLSGWSAGEESGIPSVAVKCVDIRRNTSGEGGFLD